MASDGAHRRSASLLERALADAGGLDAPAERVAHLRALLLDELRVGAGELRLARSGYRRPVVVAIAPRGPGLIAVAPVDPMLRSDAAAVGEREWLLVAALTGSLVEAAANVPSDSSGPMRRPESPLPSPTILAGDSGGWLALALAVPPRYGTEAAELAAIAFEDQARLIDRLRARAHAVPAAVLTGAEELREPIGATHPLRVAETVARLGGRPADERSVSEHEEAVLAGLGDGAGAVRPHAEADPGLRVARRIVQRLAGMGKWGGYHTDVAHLPRGFAGHDRALAIETGERLIASGLLLEKRSVGQRHVFLNPRRTEEIYALIDRGEVPATLSLP